MAKKREWPEDPTSSLWANTRTKTAFTNNRAMNDIEAIISLAPGQTPDMLPMSSTHELREALADAVDKLSPEEEWIFNILFIAGLSLRLAGRVLGIPKTTLARRRDAIRLKLLEDLTENPEVKQWLQNKHKKPSTSE
jgi:DNA-directed RNA polymerase specialized sigma24 family protein